MGLLLDLSPDAELDDSGGNDAALEAELLALMGGGGKGRVPGKKEGGKGKKRGKITFFIIVMIHFLKFCSCASSCAHGGHRAHGRPVHEGPGRRRRRRCRPGGRR